MSNLKLRGMAQRIAALETGRPERGWQEVFAAMTDAELYRLEALVVKLEPNPDEGWRNLGSEDRAFLWEVEGRRKHGADAAAD